MGILIILFGVIMLVGSLGYEGPYKIAAPISMGLIILLGILVMFLDKVKSWLAK